MPPAKLGYSSSVKRGSGSSRKYSFRVPAMAFTSISLIMSDTSLLSAGNIRQAAEWVWKTQLSSAGVLTLIPVLHSNIWQNTFRQELNYDHTHLSQRQPWAPGCPLRHQTLCRSPPPPSLAARSPLHTDEQSVGLWSVPAWRQHKKPTARKNTGTNI